MQMLWSEMKWSCDPDQIFIPLLSVRSSDWYGLFSFWWKYPGNLLWRWNGELFCALLFAFHLFLFSSSYFFFIVLVAVYLHVGPLSILSGFVVPGRAVNMIWTCSVFCYFKPFEDALLSAHYPQPQVSKLTGICWVWVCIFRLSSSVYHTDLQHTHWSGLQCTLILLIFSQ